MCPSFLRSSLSLSPRPGRDCHRPGLEAPYMPPGQMKASGITQSQPCSLWLPHQLTQPGSRTAQTGFQGFCSLRAGSLATVVVFFHSLFLAVFLPNSTPLPHIFSLFSLPSQSLPGCYNPQAKDPGSLTSFPLPCPRLRAPFQPWAPCQANRLTQEVSIYLRQSYQ